MKKMDFGTWNYGEMKIAIWATVGFSFMSMLFSIAILGVLLL